MSTVIKKSEVRKLFPHRGLESHKGDNGRVLIVGGSLEFFGAPILAGLGALSAGADLITLLVPECNFEVSRSFYPDFIVRKYPGNHLNSRILDHIESLLEKTDALLIGPGVTEDPEILRVITRIIQKATCPCVLDAEAIPALALLGLPTENPAHRAEKLIITPHRAEMNEITEGALPDDFDLLAETVTNFSEKWGVTTLLKGHRDIIVAPSKSTRINETGNPGMTVGGTGDVLAGVTASIIAQHLPAFEACLCAAYLNGAAGDNLLRLKGYQFSATDLALELPYTIHGIVD